MKRILIILIIIVAIASFVGTGYYLYQKSEEPPVIYETNAPFKTDIERKTVATGSIVPRKEIDVKSQVSGVIEKLFIEAGNHVKAGDKIAKVKLIPNVVALNNADVRIKTAIINFKNAEVELDRQRELFEQKVISEFDYNQFLLNYNLAKQEVEAAENNMQLIKEGASKQEGMSSNIVRATSSGMLLDIPVKEGAFVIESNTFNDGTTIATIANMTDMIFEGKVDEAEVGKLKEGMDLSLTIGALDTVSFNAKLEYISPKGVEEQGAIQFEIKAAVSLRSDNFLRAGYSANADIVLETKQQVLAIKESDIQFDEDEKPYVELMVAEQEFEKRILKTGISDGINIEILDGLSTDDKYKRLSD
ncbi:ABC transporter, RND-adapter-like protein [hydrothermal vent metagenome]|uniref:ABC transporter, RND-adapter-like protein n=1 Tax=hydrothermal vent metagenome TaxID=652676 RepID=A0A3B0UEG8_9ZZZZ